MHILTIINEYMNLWLYLCLKINIVQYSYKMILFMKYKRKTKHLMNMLLIWFRSAFIDKIVDRIMEYVYEQLTKTKYDGISSIIFLPFNIFSYCCDHNSFNCMHSIFCFIKHNRV